MRWTLRLAGEVYSQFRRWWLDGTPLAAHEQLCA